MSRRFDTTRYAPTPLETPGDASGAPIRPGPPAPSRRRVLRASLLAAAGFTPFVARARASTGDGNGDGGGGSGTRSERLASPARPVPGPDPDHLRLAFTNTHTGEHLDLVYQEGGRYLDDALAAIDHLLRDHRTGDVMPIDRALLDTLASLRRRLGTTEPFHVISGYRSPATNAKLAAASGGVARNSMHLQGRAIDIRVPDRSLELVHGAALAMNAGGVGYYRSSNFVHLDTGRVRSW